MSAPYHRQPASPYDLRERQILPYGKPQSASDIGFVLALDSGNSRPFQ